jgi:hypothetical protein
MGIYIKKTREIDTHIKIPSVFTDAWHLFKSTSIFLLVFSILCFDFHNRIFFDNYWLNQFMWVAIYGLSWIFPFNYFFNKIFVIKNK